MQRREFISVLGASAAAWPLAARAQQRERMRRVGVLMAFPTDAVGRAQAEVAALRKGLADLGWIEGRNIEMDYRWPGGDAALARAIARDVLARKPDLVLTRSTPTTAAVLAESRSIPIIFLNVGDPIHRGLWRV